MSFWKRLKNLWRLSECEFDTLPLTNRVILTSQKEETQFIEPISFKEKFTQANNLDDLLE